MRAALLAVTVIIPCIAFSADPRTKPAVNAVPAVPATTSAAPKAAGTLIDSNLEGRDLAFLTSAIEEGKVLRYLASQTERTSNPDLRGFGAELVSTLAAQSAVLNTVAELRKLTISEEPSAEERRIAAKVAPLAGAKLEKVLLDEFRSVDRRTLATYETGLALDDQTIHKLCEQTLPHIRAHLAVVDAMAGIAPKHAPGEPLPVKIAPVKITPAKTGPDQTAPAESATVKTAPAEKAPAPPPSPVPVKRAPVPKTGLPPKISQQDGAK